MVRSGLSLRRAARLVMLAGLSLASLAGPAGALAGAPRAAAMQAETAVTVIPVQNIARDAFRWQLSPDRSRQYRPPSRRNDFDRWDRRQRPVYRPPVPYNNRSYRVRPNQRVYRGLDARQAACARRYRTYDPRTNTFFIRPGVRAVCRL